MAKTKSKIEKLFDKRKATYEKHTSDILASIDGVIEGIKLYASAEGLLEDDMYFEVLASSIDPETKFVFIVGAILPEIGSTIVTAEGEDITINDAVDQGLHSRTLQVNISDVIIAENDPVTTCDYIDVATANMRALEQQLADIDSMFDGADDDVPEFADFDSTSPVLSESDKANDEKLRKILEGATNKSGLFN